MFRASSLIAFAGWWKDVEGHLLLSFKVKLYAAKLIGTNSSPGAWWFGVGSFHSCVAWQRAGCGVLDVVSHCWYLQVEGIWTETEAKKVSRVRRALRNLRPIWASKYNVHQLESCTEVSYFHISFRIKQRDNLCSQEQWVPWRCR
jgi:hypothetical protein